VNYNAVHYLVRISGLLDEVGDSEKHPLFSLLDTLGTLVQVYEEEHAPMPESSGIEVLRYLMEEHQLVQSDLTEVGSQGVASEVLSGKRELNVRQIRELAKRFHVSPGVFI
jgi:HTH-type transcriptional regulator/antitoxin HigA